MSRQISPIGALRTPIELEGRIETPDDGGGVTVAWSAIATIWANFAPVNAEERAKAYHLQVAVSHRIVLRRRADIDGNHRFRLGERLFRIRAAYDPDEGGRFLVCLVEEEKP